MTDKYRGAVVEDLQLPPAFSVSASDTIARVIEAAFDRDFSHVPVLDQKRRPVGYVDVARLKSQWEAGKADPNDRVQLFMTKFRRTTETPYTVITPLTELAELESFLQDNIFALVTDQNRKFVLGLATKHDLENFVTRRGL